MENFTDDHQKALEKYVNINLLSLNSFGLKSLKNFPKLLELKVVREILNFKNLARIA